MNKTEIISEAGQPVFRWLGKLNIIFLLALISSPFVGVWYSWSLAWKIGLSGLLGCILCYVLYRVIRTLLSFTMDNI